MERKRDPLISYMKIIMSEYNDCWNSSVTEEISYDPEKKYIMFIDNEKDLLDVVRQELPCFVGYDIITLTSCMEALKVFLLNPDRCVLIVINYIMPGMTGLEFAEEILQCRPSVPVILSTGFNNMIIEEKAVKIGIKEIIVKPFGLNELAGYIHRILENDSSE